jgi:hypothetical protein
MRCFDQALALGLTEEQLRDLGINLPELPAEKVEELDAPELPRKGTRRPGNRRERRRQNSLHDSERSKKNVRKNKGWNPRYYDKFMGWTNELVNDHRQKEAEKIDLAEAMTVDRQKWVLNMEFYAYWCSEIFYGTEQELQEYIQFRDPYNANYIWLNEKEERAVNQQTGEVVPVHTLYPQEYIDYSDEENRTDFGKVLSRSIGYEKDIHPIICWEVTPRR